MKMFTLARVCLYSMMLLFFALQPAIANQQQGRPLTMAVKNKSLPDILRAITKKTGVNIYFSDNDLSEFGSISIDVKDKEVTEVLHDLLDQRGLVFTVFKDDFITVKRGKPAVQLKAGDSLHTVTGRVVDEKGGPVIGATVMVAGTKVGVTTDQNGVFKVIAVKNGSLLTISSIGFTTKDIFVGSKSSVGDISLKEYVSTLDETVIIAYGTTSARVSTSPVLSIKAKDIEKQPVSNPLLALEGRMPGVFITQSTGYAGTGVSIKIQGQNSIRNGIDPLYVVDGVPYSSQLLPTINQIVGQSSSQDSQYPATIVGNPLSYINPADIESIEVLKDADATAIYGSRAANGAVLITTKRASQGKIRLQLGIQTGWSQATRRLPLLKTPQYLQLRREALANDHLTPDPDRDFDLFNNYGWDTTRSTNWQKELIGNTANTTAAYASLSGGNENANMMLSSSYRRESAVIPGNFANQKGSVNLNIGMATDDQKLRFNVSGNYLIDDNRLPSIDLTSLAVTLPPDAPNLHTTHDSLNWAPNGSGNTTWASDGNPISNLLNKYKNKTTNLIANGILVYTPFTGLTLKGSLGYNSLKTSESQIYPLSAYAPEIRPSQIRLTTFGNNSVSSWIFEPQLNYKKSWDRLHLDFLLGGTIQENKNDAERLNATGYESDDNMSDLSTSSKITLGYAINSEYKYNAIFGRLNLILDEKYILNLTGRRDGTSRFGSDNLFHNFTSVAAAWIFTNENFIKNVLPFLSFGKLRGSIGTTGSDQIGDYRYLELYSRIFGTNPYEGTIGMLPSALANPYLQWELTKKLQGGIDLGFMHDRLLLNVNYFRNQSSNQLLDYNVPITTGFGSITSNFPATIRNTGWEIMATTTNIHKNNFSWRTSINLTLPKNRLVAFPGLANTSYAFQYKVGYPLNIAKTYTFAGVNSTTGTYQFYNAKGEITDNPDYFNDRNTIISLDPKYYGGFQNTLTYRKISLDVLFQYVCQQGANYQPGNFPGVFSGTVGNQPDYILDRWQRPGDKKTIQKYNSDYSLIGQTFNALSSNFAYGNASYVRLKNVSLTWQASELISKTLRVKDLEVFLSGQNLLTVTGYKGLDPETRSSKTLPPLRTLTIGLKANL
jgi:TonB-dependent starch-binding outer membrane protein SusC